MAESDDSLVIFDHALQIAPPRPAWVSVSLWRIQSRRLAQFWALFSAAAATAGVYAGVTTSPVFLASAALYAAALWYWAAIRWMDARGAWGPEDSPPLSCTTPT